MSSPSPGVTELLSAWQRGDPNALERLVPIVYSELRRLAGRCMRRENPGHTLQTTALVHEAYLRLANEQDRTWENRAHFFAVAAQVMRNLLVDHARANARAKRGGGRPELVLDVVPEVTGFDADLMLALDEALQRLATVDPRAGRIVELRYFVGLTNEEVAAVMDISEKTVKRDWSAAKAWLQGELRGKD
jgi:RNA polymerase sigma-70 factor (ECF subfamily)